MFSTHKLSFALFAILIALNYDYTTALTESKSAVTYKSIVSIQRETTLIEDYLNKIEASFNEIRASVADIPIVKDVVDAILAIIRLFYQLEANLKDISSQLSGNYKHLCTGTIISANHILTTGHCIQGRTEDQIKIKVGVSDWGVSAPLHAVEQFKPHSNFTDFDTYYADMALIKLKTPLVFNSEIQPAFMPQYLNANDFNDLKASSTYGKLYSFDTDLKNPPGGKLMSADVVFSQYDTCKQGIVSDPDYAMCARGPNTGICLADQGAPILVNFNGQEIIYAIALKASFDGVNEECTAVNTPVMFLKTSSLHVTFFLAWQA